MKMRIKDNRGIALITVVIGVMFCLLLTSTMLRVSLIGLNSRKVNNQTSVTFYSAETVIDSAAMNVQNIAAKAWAETDTQNYTSCLAYVQKVYNLLTGGTFPEGDAPHTLSTEEKTALINVLKVNIIQGGVITSVGNIEKYLGTTNKLEGFTIKDIEVEYKDPSTGMLSKVKTDLTVRSPLYKKTKTNSYSFLAGGGMTVSGPSGSSQDGSIRVYGKAYCGYLKNTDTWENNRESIHRADVNLDEKYDAAVALRLSNDCNLFFHGDVEINGDVYVGNKCNLSFLGSNVTIRGSVFLDSSANLIIKDGCKFKCRAIFVDQEFDSNGNPKADKISTGNLIDRTTGEAARKGTYSCDGGGAPINHLPFAKKDKPGGEGWDTDYDTSSSQIFSCNSFSDDPAEQNNNGKATRIGVSNGLIDNTVVKFTFDHTAEPVKNVTTLQVKNGNTYTSIDLTASGNFGHSVDVKFLELVDANYLLKVANYIQSKGYGNYPEKKVTSTSGTTIAETYKWNTDTINDNKVNPTSIAGGAGQWQSMGSVNVEVMIGTEPNNVANSHPMFVVVKDDIDFNDQNKDTKIHGILIAPEVIMSRPREGTNSIIPLDQYPGVTESQYQTFIDNVGLGYMNKDDNTGTSGYVIGNLILGGISTLYSSSSGGQQYVAYVEVNSNMDLVEFRNYEKK